MATKRTAATVTAPATPTECTSAKPDVCDCATHRAARLAALNARHGEAKLARMMAAEARCAAQAARDAADDMAAEAAKPAPKPAKPAPVASGASRVCATCGRTIAANAPVALAANAMAKHAGTHTAARVASEAAQPAGAVAAGMTATIDRKAARTTAAPARVNGGDTSMKTVAAKPATGRTYVGAARWDASTGTYVPAPDGATHMLHIAAVDTVLRNGRTVPAGAIIHACSTPHSVWAADYMQDLGFTSIPGATPTCRNSGGICARLNGTLAKLEAGTAVPRGVKTAAQRAGQQNPAVAAASASAQRTVKPAPAPVASVASVAAHAAGPVHGPAVAGSAFMVLAERFASVAADMLAFARDNAGAFNAAPRMVSVAVWPDDVIAFATARGTDPASVGAALGIEPTYVDVPAPDGTDAPRPAPVASAEAKPAGKRAAKPAKPAEAGTDPATVSIAYGAIPGLATLTNKALAEALRTAFREAGCTGKAAATAAVNPDVWDAAKAARVAAGGAR